MKKYTMKLQGMNGAFKSNYILAIEKELPEMETWRRFLHKGGSRLGSCALKKSYVYYTRQNITFVSR